MKKASYRVRIGANTFDIISGEGSLIVNDKPFHYVLEPVSESYFLLLLNGRSIALVLEPSRDGIMRLRINGRRTEALVQDEKDILLERFTGTRTNGQSTREIRAPMPGLVLAVPVQPGDLVQAGDGLLVLEAMKMENELRAVVEGTIKSVHVEPGTAVRKNQLLIEFEA